MSEKKTVYQKLAEIQEALKVPKGQRNKFGNYNYRKAEDVLQAAKPLLDGGIILLNDELVLIGERYYVKATASFTFNGETISTDGFARESLTKKGMDDSQVTGATSSYSRKYALNGLLAIDNTDDADSMDNRDQGQAKPAPKPKPPAKKPAPKYSDLQNRLIKAIQSGNIDGKKWMGDQGIVSFHDITDDQALDYIERVNGGEFND
jgi:hypothetical protein